MKEVKKNMEREVNTSGHFKVFSDTKMLKKLNERNHILKQSLGLKNTRTKFHMMYSSLWEGFTKNPAMMNIPIDDHMVHRGDGVFETLICVEGAIFDFDSHLERIKKSSSIVGIQWPKSEEEVKKIAIELLKASNIGKQKAILRIFISRGPGGFTANPKESLTSVLYLVLTDFTSLSEEIYLKGASAVSSEIPVKQSPFVQIKSCNYLHNVLMKKEAEEKNVDFALSFTQESYLSEGSTENVALVNQEDELLIPSFEYSLKGTTLLRVMDLAQRLVEDKTLFCVRIAHISHLDVERAKEILLTGTTLGVLPLTQMDGKAVGNGIPGPVAKKLRFFLNQDMRRNQELRTLYI